MNPLDLSKNEDGKKKPFQWAKKAAAQVAKPKGFSVVEGKKMLKMLKANGYNASALQVDGNGSFRVECALSSQPSDMAVDNPWDEVI